MSWDIDPRVEATLGLAGTAAAVALFVSPYGTFRRIVANQSTEEFPPFPYVSTLLNCIVWTIYCLPFITPERTSPLITNLIGIAFQVTFLTLFVTYAKDKALVQVRLQLSILIAFIAVFLLFVFQVLPPPSRSPVVGMFATTFNVIMFAAPLSSVAVVLRTNSVEFMPLSLSLMAFVCSGVWSCYGLYMKDVYVLVPNVLGLFLGAIQLAIYWMVSRRSASKGAYKSMKHGGSSDTIAGPTDQEIISSQDGRPISATSKVTHRTHTGAPDKGK